MINKSITHYRDDIDLQNLIDFGQREVSFLNVIYTQPMFYQLMLNVSRQFGCCGAVTYMDWSQNMYFNCTTENPSRERCSVPFSCCIITKQKVIIFLKS